MELKNILEKTLSNGLKVICLKKSDAPIVSIQVWYKTGSVNEVDGIRGISHFLEHMMFRGSKNVKSEEHAQKINGVGGHCNAFTAEDLTGFTNSVPREYFEMVLELEADRMDSLQLEANLFETERKVVIEEFHTYMNNPIAKAFLEFRQEFFKGHPYSTSPLGTMQDLQSFTIDQCRSYYQSWYSPDNAIIVIVGDIDEELAFEKVEKCFGCKVASGKFDSEETKTALETFNDAHRMQRKVEFDVPMLLLGYPAPPSWHEDAVALEILQLVISGGESSRLHRQVVRRESVAVMAGGMNHLLKRAGMSMFFAAFTPDISAGKVESSLLKQVEQIRNSGISAEEIEKVKNSTLTNRTFELYSAENICNRIGYSECIEGDYKLWVERLDAIKLLDKDHLTEVAGKYWNDSHKHVLYLKPKKVKPILYIGGLLRRFMGNRN